MTQVAQQLHDTETARVDEANAKANMTFTQRYGAPLAEVLFRFCRVGGDADLPEVHQISAMNDKRSRDTANINICLYTQSLKVQFINAMNLPKVTSWTLNLFRQHDLVGNGIELGAGLNPFSVICAGHHNTKDALLLAKRQAAVEAGAAVSLQDTLEFKTKDARFPKTYLQASDKLWAFALLCRVYFGEANVLYTHLVASLEFVCPLVQNLESVFSTSKKEGILIAIRTMLAYQSKTQAWLRAARAMETTTVIDRPDFSCIQEALESQTYDSLPRVPDQWMETVKTQVAELWPVVHAPEAQRIRGGGGGAGGGGIPGLSPNKVKHQNPDRALMKRWKDNGYGMIGDLANHWTGEGDYCIPCDPAGEEMCLQIQLKGECKAGCRRKKTHKVYGRDTMKKVGDHLTKCGVQE